MVACYGSIIDGVFFIGESIQLTAHALDGIDYLNGSTPLSAFECHVLTEMSQSFFAFLLMTCACLDGKTAEDNVC
jgi:hypothetical protein